MDRVWLLLISAGCWHTSPPSSPPPPQVDDAGAAAAAASGGPPARAPLDGRLQIARAGMCGGARVPDNYQPPPLRPVPGITLHVWQGDTYSAAPPVMELQTAADGTFTGALPAGRYCVARDHGARPTAAGQWTDLGCLVTRWETCEAVVDVPVKARVAIDIHEPCAWAVCYHGPPPP